VVLNINVPQTVTFDLLGLDTGPFKYVNGGSVGEPATSPYAMAVGAVCTATGAAEPFSSTGPTIDGRSKPDIAAFDGVSTLTFGTALSGSCNTGFLGTSAAAPHATGAAALVKSANPSFDAAQIQDYLETHAVAPKTTNRTGHGVLNMGPQEVPQARQGDTYVPLAAPQRVLDTRTTTGGHPAKLGAGEVFTVSIPGLPDDATAVAVNLTGTQPSAFTHIDLFPATYTGTSTLNLKANQTAAVFTMLALGPNHTIKIRNEAGQTHALIDLVGSFVPNGGGTFVAKNPPARLLDTRTTTGGHLGTLGPGETFALQVRGVAGVPDDATAVMVNVTGANQTNLTFLDVFPETPTGTSTLNLDGGKGPRANLAAVGIGADGKIRIRNANGTVHVVIDLEGWFVPNGGARFVAVDPTTRILDTRTGNGLRLGALGANTRITLQGSMIYGVPYNATAVFMNLTAVAPTTGTFVTAWPSGLPFPNTSNINVNTGEVTPNAVVVGVGTSGTVTLRNEIGSVHLVADLTGYFA
jgi:Subtilase family